MSDSILIIMDEVVLLLVSILIIMCNYLYYVTLVISRVRIMRGNFEENGGTHLSDTDIMERAPFQESPRRSRKQTIRREGWPSL